MNRDKREPEYPAELESQFLLRLPEEPANQLRDVLKTGENLKNRLTIQVENDMRHGEVRFDHWLMHAKVVDMPTITESLKTIDNKSFYKSADVCQMMVCKLEPDQSPAEEETPTKNKKKDPYKVDKKYLFPHGITPPTKNVRKRRFRKTLRKKCVEAPEIEKEVKRLLRADQEAESMTWEIVKEDDEQIHSKAGSSTAGSSKVKSEKKSKAERARLEHGKSSAKSKEPSNVIDIFGGAVSDSEEEDNINVELEDSRMSAYDSRLSDTDSMQGSSEMHGKTSSMPIQFDSNMFQSQKFNYPSSSLEPIPSSSGMSKSGNLSSEEDLDYSNLFPPKTDMQPRIDQLKVELAEMRQRRTKMQTEIAGLQNLALRQRFEETLNTLNKDILYKDMEYQGLLVMQNEDI